MTGAGAEAVRMRLQTGKISGGEVENAVGIVLTGVKLAAVHPLYLLVKEHNIHPSVVVLLPLYGMVHTLSKRKLWKILP